jgi:hypothetical protein
VRRACACWDPCRCTIGRQESLPRARTPSDLPDAPWETIAPGEGLTRVSAVAAARGNGCASNGGSWACAPAGDDGARNASHAAPSLSSGAFPLKGVYRPLVWWRTTRSSPCPTVCEPRARALLDHAQLAVMAPIYQRRPSASTIILRMPTPFEGSVNTRISSVLGSKRTTVLAENSLAHTIPAPSTVTA